MAFTTHRVTGNMNVIDWNVCAKEWPRLQGLRFHHLGPRLIVDILICIIPLRILVVSQGNLLLD